MFFCNYRILHNITAGKILKPALRIAQNVVICIKDEQIDLSHLNSNPAYQHRSVVRYDEILKYVNVIVCNIAKIAHLTLQTLFSTSEPLAERRQTQNHALIQRKVIVQILQTFEMILCMFHELSSFSPDFSIFELF